MMFFVLFVLKEQNENNHERKYKMYISLKKNIELSYAMLYKLVNHKNVLFICDVRIIMKIIIQVENYSYSIKLHLKQRILKMLI